ncbi:dickkopf-related protein 3-like [Clytia hemisphaerica]|uniref:Dickkopf N-terminal cysteine-rich domain-containing protein n=1 Tax=Clytia hemisphaerica TaxID=252671 RepID=A0A7M5TWG2_9CNID|eukprot:TCONS_00047171-protein
MNLSTFCVFFAIFSLVSCKPATKENDVETSLMKDILERAFGLDKKKEGVSEISKKDEVTSLKQDQANDRRSHVGASHDDTREILGRCDINKKCEASQYCDGMFCYKCRTEGHHCDLNGECCAGSECQFGICTKGAAQGDPGTFCDIAKDCKGKDVCCIREISISHHHSICKLMLNEHESCGPINLFHQDTMRAHMEPICGPCKAGLSCKGVGIFGRHSICLPENEE